MREAFFCGGNPAYIRRCTVLEENEDETVFIRPSGYSAGGVTINSQNLFELNEVEDIGGKRAHYWQLIGKGKNMKPDKYVYECLDCQYQITLSGVLFELGPCGECGCKQWKKEQYVRPSEQDIQKKTR